MVPVVLYFSWIAFWAASLLILSYCTFRRGAFDAASFDEVRKLKGREWAVVLCFSVAAVVLTLAVSRSDLDDAFYVAVAAFASGNPSEPLLAFDPMHGERTLPLGFPSYRFASFELLAGAIAYLLGIPAMDIMYKALPPLWAVTSVFCTFLLAQELMPKRWLLLGAIALLLVVILGETHRAPANFVFVRMFQGKAVYLSVVVPAIFYLTARYFSARGTLADLFLLGCTQITGIGMTGFGMLAAPMAGVGALISNACILERGRRIKLWGVLVTLASPIPYLIAAGIFPEVLRSFIAVAFNWVWGLSLPPSEAAFQVWKSVFGASQQYLVAILLLAGPVLAQDAVIRRRLAIPPLLLFAIYLNPWLADFICIYAPDLYWRVVWTFPVLVFLSASVCVIIDWLAQTQGQRFSPAILAATVVGLIVLSLPFHTLRSQNSGLQWDFAGRKIPINDYLVAEKAIHVNGKKGRLLAPDEISGVISRFEEHPKLVSVRGMYLDSRAEAFGREEYLERSALHRFVSGSPEKDTEISSRALNSLKVATIVMAQKNENEDIIRFLLSEDYRRVVMTNNYSIWSRCVSGPDSPQPESRDSPRMIGQ
jgi:hypothetical protein